MDIKQVMDLADRDMYQTKIELQGTSSGTPTSLAEGDSGIATSDESQ
jgi:hypothetical protein